MQGKPTPNDWGNGHQDRLESYGIYQAARDLFELFWDDSEVISADYRGRELVKQQIRSLDSICANIEEGYGRGYGKELPQHLKIARGEARESKGRFERCKRLLPPDTVAARTTSLDRIIGGLTKTINTIENRRVAPPIRSDARHPSPVTRHSSA